MVGLGVCHHIDRIDQRIADRRRIGQRQHRPRPDHKARVAVEGQHRRDLEPAVRIGNRQHHLLHLRPVHLGHGRREGHRAACQVEEIALADPADPQRRRLDRQPAHGAAGVGIPDRHHEDGAAGGIETGHGHLRLPLTVREPSSPSPAGASAASATERFPHRRKRGRQSRARST
jgi:hypothetical protein